MALVDFFFFSCLIYVTCINLILQSIFYDIKDIIYKIIYASLLLEVFKVELNFINKLAKNLV